MLPPAVHARRRRRLHERVAGPVLLSGNGHRARNLPMTHVPFRQDSTFLYFTGCTVPGAAAWLEDGRCTLYVPAPAPDDALWHGEVESLDALCARLGVDDVRPVEELEARARAARPATLAVPDEARNQIVSAWIGAPLRFGHDHGDDALVDAVIALRRTKEPEEVVELRAAARLTAEAHRLAMRATRPGVHERGIAALFEGYLAARDATLGYATILTQRGEVLHRHEHDEVCTAGRLLLLDGGGEVPSGYGADVTRTWPVSGRFEPRQRAAYEAVLEAQAASIALCRPGVRWRTVHDASSLVLARFLVDEGLLRGITPEDAVARGAHALFFPHGVGHLLGLDVHDLENFGDRPAYPPGVGRPEQFGTCYLRLDLPLEPGWLVTVEPGFYVVPAILSDATLRARFADVVDAEVVARWSGFGGIRIEDDVLITTGAPDVLTAAAPKGVAEVEAEVGAGVPAEALFP